ncbi:MAG: polyhydroxyalkanoate depolymerase [Dehalococcoidia bacterium]
MFYALRDSLYDFWAPARRAAAAMIVTPRDALDFARGDFAHAARVGVEIFDRMMRRWEKPEFGLHETIIDGEPVGVVVEAIIERPFVTLLRFRRESARSDPRVLLLPPMSGHFATLTRGTIESLLPHHDVYVADWANARDVPTAEGGFDLDDYIDCVVDLLQAVGPGAHVMGICQAAVPALAAVALISADAAPFVPATLTLLAGPIDPREHPTAVNEFATSHTIDWFERVMIDRVPASHRGAGRLVYPGHVQLGAFMSMNLDRHVSSYFQFVEDLVAADEPSAEAHRVFYDEYLAVMDLTAEFYLQTVRSVFQDFDLARGRMVSRERAIEPAAITRTALMTVEGGRDDITGRGQTEAAQALCSGLRPELRRHHVQADVGHFGVFSGRHWRNEIMPQVADFVRAFERAD